MPDPIQKGSAVPLPTFQTVKGSQDPLPLNSPAAQTKTTEDQAKTDGDRKADDFENYLNKTEITTLEKQQQDARDAAEQIAKQSVYQSGDTKPV